jgi:3-dehydroquinate synthase
MQKVFKFGPVASTVHIQNELPTLKKIKADMGARAECLLVCDENTKAIAEKIDAGEGLPLCALKPGEAAKTWESAEKILRMAKDAGLSRDSLIIGIGGGVITDLTGFCASIYMRGVKLALVSTTLLGMADAALGGKTGFDLFGIKNSVGTFYPADHVYMPLEALKSLQEREWKSGMAELIKTAVLDNSVYAPETYTRLAAASKGLEGLSLDEANAMIAHAVCIKAKIVEADPKETKGKRILLNLGHTFGHALEAQAGLGVVSHGEAVAWGIARACDLGVKLKITPQPQQIMLCKLLTETGYEIKTPHPALSGGDIQGFMNALESDKKKKNGCVNFVVPAKHGATLVEVSGSKKRIVEDIINGNA